MNPASVFSYGRQLNHKTTAFDRCSGLGVAGHHFDCCFVKYSLVKPLGQSRLRDTESIRSWSAVNSSPPWMQSMNDFKQCGQAYMKEMFCPACERHLLMDNGASFATTKQYFVYSPRWQRFDSVSHSPARLNGKLESIPPSVRDTIVVAPVVTGGPATRPWRAAAR